MTKNLTLLLALSEMSFLTFREKLVLESNLDTARELALLSVGDISALAGRAVRSKAWQNADIERRVAQIALVAERYGMHCVSHGDEAYPALLRALFDPPFLLYCRGDCAALNAPCVSVVGTRKPTRAGVEAARQFAADAARDGLTVVSGLAFGIDAASHAGALDGNGKTAAVLASGADVLSPRSNRRLGGMIISRGGCVVSEYAPGTEAAKWRFPQRNRVISGLSPATVIIEAPVASGALITADFALEQGRDVYFHELALQGAMLQETADSAAEPMKRSAARYCRDGAPVIRSYADYREAALNAPGRPHGGQGELDFL